MSPANPRDMSLSKFNASATLAGPPRGSAPSIARFLLLWMEFTNPVPTAQILRGWPHWERGWSSPNLQWALFKIWQIWREGMTLSFSGPSCFASWSQWATVWNVDLPARGGHFETILPYGSMTFRLRTKICMPALEALQLALMDHVVNFSNKKKRFLLKINVFHGMFGCWEI